MIERKHRNQGESCEQPIKIYFNEKPVVVTQGTPRDLEDLGVGFLLFEGYLSDRDAFIGVEASEQDLEVRVSSTEHGAESDHVLFRTTSAGCAQSSFLNKEPTVFSDTAQKMRHPLEIQSADIVAMMEQLCQDSPLRNQGEPVHGCGFGNHGKLLCVREDIGRHNAMDKLIGRAWLEQTSLSDMIFCCTGRISYEMALKAVMAGIPVMVSHKSITHSAVELAEAHGMTLIAKCRNNSMEVLSCHDSIE